MLNKVEIVLGFSCNNRCRFCSIGGRKYDKDTKKIKKDIERASREDTKEINFTGGEPTIRKDIVDLVEYANKKFDKVGVTTNGRMFSNEKFTKSITDAGLNTAIFSIHSINPKIHDFLTMVNGSFFQTIKGLKNLNKIIDNIDVNLVINSLNYRNLPSFTFKIFSDYKVRSICFIYPDIDGNIMDNLWLLPRFGDVKYFLHKSLDIVRKNNKDAWCMNIPVCFFKGYEEYSPLREMNTKMFWPEKDTNLDSKKRNNKVRIEACLNCKYKDKCSGISCDYIKLKGKKGIIPL